MTLCQGNTFLFHSSQQFPCLCLGPLKSFLSCLQDLPLASCVASGTSKDTRTLSGVLCLARRSQDSIKNNLRIPRLRICKKCTKWKKSIRIELLTIPCPLAEIKFLNPMITRKPKLRRQRKIFRQQGKIPRPDQLNINMAVWARLIQVSLPYPTIITYLAF